MKTVYYLKLCCKDKYIRSVQKMKFLCSLIVLLCLLELAICFRFINMHVPRYAKKNSTVRLECSYELENIEKLYSLKWFKDNIEFYRRTPSEVKYFSVPGIHVISELSSTNVVVLDRLDSRSSGDYSCEVIRNEGSQFRTYSINDPMLVMSVEEYNNLAP